MRICTLAVGLGCIVTIGALSLRRIATPITAEYRTLLDSAAAVTRLALIALWLTGVAGFVAAVLSGTLSDMHTGLLLAMVIVALQLTMTTLMVRKKMRALMIDLEGKTLLHATLHQKTMLALTAGLSAAGWTLLMVLSELNLLRGLSYGALIGIVCLVYAAAVLGALLGARILHVRLQKSLRRTLQIRRAQRLSKQEAAAEADRLPPPDPDRTTLFSGTIL